MQILRQNDIEIIVKGQTFIALKDGDLHVNARDDEGHVYQVLSQMLKMAFAESKRMGKIKMGKILR